MDLDRLIRTETSEFFIESTRPTIANLMETDQGERSSRSTTVSTLEDAKSALEQWDAWNARVYDIVEGSVTLSEAEINEYQSLFAKGRLGQDFYDWVIAHATSDKESAQLRYKARLNALTILSNSTSRRARVTQCSVQ